MLNNSRFDDRLHIDYLDHSDSQKKANSLAKEKEEKEKKLKNEKIFISLDHHQRSLSTENSKYMLSETNEIETLNKCVSRILLGISVDRSFSVISFHICLRVLLFDVFFLGS